MQPLIDADVLLHEIGWSNEFKDKETGQDVLLNFDRVAEMVDQKIWLIGEEVFADQEPILFISNSENLSKQTNKLRRWQGEPEVPYLPNFRYERAVSKPYKGTRKNPKPFHFDNILAYLLGNYDCRIANGIEADDAMGIEQTKRPHETIICSRDKDLRMVPGYHYSWECGKQAAIGPVETEGVGWLETNPSGQLVGYGYKFFCAQMLMGDSVDNIPGLPKAGKAFAKALLEPLNTVEDLYTATKQAYIDKLGTSKDTKEYFLEQADLLWIMREEGKHFAPPIIKGE